MFLESLVLTDCKQIMTSFRVQTSWAKMMSAGGKPTAPSMLCDRKVNKAEKLTNLSRSIQHFTNLVIKFRHYMVTVGSMFISITFTDF